MPFIIDHPLPVKSTSHPHNIITNMHLNIILSHPSLKQDGHLKCKTGAQDSMK